MEGNNSDIEILAPAIFPMEGRTVHMQARATNGDLLFAKTTANGGSITLAGQLITITILPADTLRKSGSHLWELKAHNDTDGIVRLANGPFKIKKQTCIV